ncbi:SDR family oxidoreductase [Brachybacterium saurashtrense]|uniref:SDR family NAD(P)-dependent oxidoreductase n=1 Tax=Brachybacterium saurashtrense TaxID=556288 RepID=A0A345YPQ3_9MICO|nr:SDR family oxidoreductase [Brachybacterium saurashtrense]AXK45905.1 SDR family NAD(P)-dependent oxidoreductase [Brachybacterium saurashtrense]RRR23643.1 SDR family NAD(P)-dependent oxidoreductase [Brachybacterium saurashtrense]
MSHTTIPARVALVTGASGGIGGAIAERLAADGMAVVAHYSSRAAGAEEVVDRITAQGGRALALGGDVADEDAMTSLFQTAIDTFGGVDVVINAAGIMPLAPVAETDLEVLDRVLRTNVRGTFVIDQLAARHLRRGGALVNVSTSITRLQTPTYGAYAASKGAVEALTLVLARELRGRDITVNTVAPGPTATPLFFEGKTKQMVEGITALSPMERLGRPEDIAEVAAFLAGPGRWVNGQTIHANGGAA